MKFDFDLLDATKIIPEELVPVTPIGRMVLNRNVDYFFGETEQVAFVQVMSYQALTLPTIHSYRPDCSLIPILN